MEHPTHSPTSLQSSVRPIIVLLLLGIVLGCVAAPAVFLENYSSGRSISLYSLAGAIVFLFAGMWAVFGIGPYLWRTMIGCCVIAIPVVSVWSSIKIYESYQEINYQIVDCPWRCIFLSVFAIGVAGQIPFWLARLVGGWRFRLANGVKLTGVSIRDLFSIVFIFALAFGCFQLSDRLYKTSAVEQIVVGSQTLERVELDANVGPGYTFQYVDVTEANYETMKSKAIQQADNRVFLGVSGYVLIFGLLMMPCIWLAFSRSLVRSLLLTLLYGSLIVMVVACATRWFSADWNFLITDSFLLPMFVVLATILGSWFAMRLLRWSGIELQTRWSKTNPRLGQDTPAI